MAVIKENQLLAEIPENELARVRRHLRQVELPFDQVLAEVDEKIGYAYFLMEEVISMVNEPENGDITEFATIGNEGMGNFAILLGTLSMPSRTIVQVSGSALRIRTSDLLEALREAPNLHRR